MRFHLSSLKTLPEKHPMSFPGCPSLYLAALCCQRWEQCGLCLPSFKGSEQGSKKCRWPNCCRTGHLLLPANFANTRTPARPVWPPRGASFRSLRSPTEAEPFRSAAQNYFHVCSAVKPRKYILRQKSQLEQKEKERKRLSHPFLSPSKPVMSTNNKVVTMFFTKVFRRCTHEHTRFLSPSSPSHGYCASGGR